MPKKVVSVEIESSGHDLMLCVAGVIKAQKASGQGLQEAIADLQKVVDSVGSLPADAKEDVGELLKGINLGAWDILEALKG